jgi:hypothetical protein
MNWKFKVFLKDNGENVMDEWLETLPFEDQAKIEARITLLKATPIGITHYFDKYHKSKNIYEIRINGNRVKYRPLGFQGPGKGVFTLLMGAKERDGKLVPNQAIRTAEQRCVLVMSNPGRYLDEY